MFDDILMPHQKETIDYGLKNPYFIMGLAPGLGKSIVSFEIVRRLKVRAKRDLNVLYICPASVKLNIKDEIKCVCVLQQTLDSFSTFEFK